MGILERNGESSNGRTPGSDPGNLGSSPSSPAKINTSRAGLPDYIEAIYEYVLVEKRPFSTMACAVLKSKGEFHVTGEDQVDGWIKKYRVVKDKLTIQQFFDVMSGKTKYYGPPNDS